jgi:hypothetical protein
MGKTAKELTVQEELVRDQFLGTPTSCVGNAPPADGNLPLVIYHSGNGSSFENNSVMTSPLLMVANSHAFFQLADSLSFARRYYLAVRGMDHNEFIS